MTSQAAANSPVEIPPLRGIYVEPLSASKLWRMLGFFGPAAVVASLSLGAGETIMATGLGAWAGYDLLWLLVLSVVVKGVFVTYLIGRYTAVTGRPIGDRLVELPGPRGWLLLAIVAAEVVLIPLGLAAAVAKPCGNLVTYLQSQAFPLTESQFAFWENAWTSVLLAAAFAVSLLSSYGLLEKQQVWICGILIVGTLAATLIVGPSLKQLLLGTIMIGNFPTPPDWAPPTAREHYVLNLVTIFGYVGGSLSGYLAYSNWISLHGWGLNAHPDIERIRARAKRTRSVAYLPDDREQARRLRTLLLPLRCDAGMGAIVLLVVTGAFMTAGAVVLYPKHLPPPDSAFQLLTSQADIWRAIHSSLVPVYDVLVLAALWGTLAAAPEAVCRVVHSFLAAVWPEFDRVPFRKLQLVTMAWFVVASFACTWLNFTFDMITQIGAFLTLNLGVAVVAICAVYFNATLPRYYRPRLWVLVGGALSAGVLVVCAAGSTVGLWSKLMQTP